MYVDQVVQPRTDLNQLIYLQMDFTCLQHLDPAVGIAIAAVIQVIGLVTIDFISMSSNSCALRRLTVQIIL